MFSDEELAARAKAEVETADPTHRHALVFSAKYEGGTSEVAVQLVRQGGQWHYVGTLAYSSRTGIGVKVEGAVTW